MNEPTDAPSNSENWKDRITIPPEYSSYRTRFINLLDALNEVWNVHLGQISTATNRIELSSLEAGSIDAVP